MSKNRPQVIQEVDSVRQQTSQKRVDLLWDRLKNKQKFLEVELVDPSSPKPENHIRFVCVSDTHNQDERIPFMPKGDVLIHAGDFSNKGTRRNILSFNEWLGEQPYETKIVIAGNHDIAFDIENYKALKPHFHPKSDIDPIEVKSLLTDCIYLEDSSVTVKGYKLYGSPWTPYFYGWAFNLHRDEILETWQRIPTDTDILITHGPPLGRGDLCKGGARAGCEHLLKEIQERIKPKYHIFGHIHEGYGASSDGTTTYINASTCTYRYLPSNEPIVFDLPIIQ